MTTIMAEYLQKKSPDDECEKICFVCTGNTCRSPMAEALFNYLNKDKNIKAVSAGISAYGMQISEKAVRALNKRGIQSNAENDFKNHISRMINEKIMSECSKIIAMTGNHAMLLMGSFPNYASKIFAMPCDISDPFGGNDSIYEMCLSEIEEGITEIFPELGKSGGDSE